MGLVALIVTGDTSYVHFFVKWGSGRYTMSVVTPTFITEPFISATIARNIRQYEDELSELKTQLETTKLDTGFKITAEAVEYFLKEMVKKNDRYKLDTFQAFIRRIVITGDKVEIYYNYHSIPNILKNPVNKMLTGCSSSIAMVTR